MPRLVPISAILVALLTAAGSVAAQGTPPGADIAVDAAVGKALLDEGRKLLQDGHAKEALDKLEASVQRDPSPAALLELGACQEKLGATASAWGSLRRAWERARALGERDVAEQAEKRGSALEPRLTRVRVVVQANGDGPEVVLDDRWTLPRNAWGVPLPLDPGQHRVKATAAGKSPFNTTFEIKREGETRDVLVPQLAAIPQLAPRTAPAREAAPPAIRPSSVPHAEEAGIGLLVIGSVGLAGGGGLLIYFPSPPRNVVIGGTMTGVGAACLLVGAVFMTEPKPPRTTLIPFQVSPLVARSGAGLILQGAF